MTTGTQAAPSDAAAPASSFGIRDCLLLPAAIGGLLLAGLALALQPVLVIGLAGGIAYVWMCLRWPVQALGAYLFVHIAFPAYIRIPPSLPVPPSVGMLAVLAGATLLARLVGERNPGTGPAARRFAVAFALFGAIGFFSILDPHSNGDSVNMWIKVFVFPAVTAWVVACHVRDEADIGRVFDAMLAAACLTALYGIYEYIVGSNYLFENFMDPGMTDATMYRTADVLGSSIAYRSFSVSSQPIEFGAWLSMLTPYALIRFTRAATLPAKALFAAAFALLILGVIVTFSRGCMLAVVVTSVALGLILPPLRVWLAAGVAGLLLAGAAIWPYIADKVTDRAADVGNVTLRFKLWQTAFAIFQDNPVKGVGLGNFPHYQPDAVRQHEIGPFYEFGLDQADLIGVAENTYLQLAAETGVIGIAAFAFLLLNYFWLSAVLARKASSPARRDLALCLAISGLAYMVNGLTITAYTHYITTLIFFGALFGFLVVLLRVEHREETLASAERPSLPVDRNFGNSGPSAPPTSARSGAASA